MKWLFLKSGIFVLISLFAAPLFSHSVTFYGFESIQYYHGSANGPFFVQLGGFSGRLNAYHFQRKMQEKISQTIKIERKGGSYVVMVGPLSSIAEVKEVANQAKSRFVPIHASRRQRASVPVANNIRPEKEPLEKEPIERFALINENWYLGALAGVQWNDVTHKVQVYNGANGSNGSNGSRTSSPYNQDTFISGINNQIFAGVIAGYRWEFNNRWLPAFDLGLRYHRVFARNLGKSILQYSLLEFADYNYNWELYSDVALAAAKVNFLQYRFVSPYISGAVGAAFNRARSYKEVALSGVTPRISPAFADNMVTQLAYNFGVGLDMQFSNRFIVSLGYEYQNLGNVSSGSGLDTWVGQSLSVKSYKSNAALLSMSYLFGDR